MADNLEHEFFTKVKGWDFVAKRGHPWHSPGGGRYFELPPISTSWDAFHEWVLPELNKKAGRGTALHVLEYKRGIMYRIGNCYVEDKTPQRALEWAMEELGR